MLGNGDSPDGKGWQLVNSGNGGQFLSACGSVSTDVPWFQMKGWELYGIRRRWQGIVGGDPLLCRKEAHIG